MKSVCGCATRNSAGQTPSGVLATVATERPGEAGVPSVLLRVVRGIINTELTVG